MNNFNSNINNNLNNEKRTKLFIFRGEYLLKILNQFKFVAHMINGMLDMVC